MYILYHAETDVAGPSRNHVSLHPGLLVFYQRVRLSKPEKQFEFLRCAIERLDFLLFAIGLRAVVYQVNGVAGERSGRATQ